MLDEEASTAPAADASLCTAKAAAHVLFVIGPNDSWKVDIVDEDEGAGQGIISLLAANPDVRSLAGAETTRVTAPGQTQTRLPEYRLLLLQMLRHLMHKLRDHPSVSRIDISIIPCSALNELFRLQGDHSAESSNVDRLLGVSRAARRAPQLSPWHGLIEGGASSSSSSSAAAPLVRFRECSAVSCLLDSEGQSIPLRVLYVPNPMWWQDICHRQHILSSLQLLASRVAHHQQATRPAVICPPPEWQQVLEMKHQVCKRFGDIMLPGIWEQVMPNEASSIGVAARLAAQVPSEGGTFVLKCAWADGARGTRFGIVFPEAARTAGRPLPQGLVRAIDEIRSCCHESWFGLQEEVPGLRGEEYRAWCVATASSKGGLAYQVAVVLKTSFVDGPDEPRHRSPMTAVISSPLTTNAALCHELVNHILTSDQFSEFRSQLLEIGCLALRIDCGVRQVNNQPVAFVNEFTAPSDASIFTFAHETDLVVWLGAMFAERLLISIR